MKVEASQGYIHYRKGSCVMYYLKEMIGEDKINSVLKKLVDEFAYSKPPFPTSLDLVEGLREVTPEEYRYLLKDLFEEITLFANSAQDVTYEKTDDDKYKITLKVRCEKYRADEEGLETKVDIDDWLDIGAFAKPEGDKRFGKTLFRESKKIDSEETTFEFVVDELPEKVGVDPFALLIDRMPADNMKKPKQSTGE